MSALALAKTTGTALWADDLGLRNLASEFEVATFGTVNLLEAQILNRINAATSPVELASAGVAQRQLLTKLIEHRVADQPVSPAIIIENIAQHPDELAPAADFLRRGTWWAALDTIHPWADIIRAVRAHAPATVRDWQARAISGIVESMPTPYGVGVVATLVAMGTEEVTSLDDILEGINIADIICRRQELARPSLILPLIAQQQAMCEPDQSPEQFLTALMEGLTPDAIPATTSAHVGKWRRRSY